MKKRSTESGADAFSQAPVNKDGIITGDMTEEMAAKTNAIIEKVDKESATRKFTGKIKSFFYIFAILVSLYHCTRPFSGLRSPWCTGPSMWP